MNWWDLLKSPNSKYWEKVSSIIVEEFKDNPNDNTRNTIAHLFNKLIRENYTKKDTQKFIDRLYESGNRKLLSLIHFYGVYFELKPHNFLPKMVIDVMGDIPYRTSFSSFASESPKYKKYENFEGFIIHKVDRNYSRPYGEDDSIYTVEYMSNGIIFAVHIFGYKNKYRPFFNKFIKGKTILEERDTKREKIPLRKIRARGI